LIFYVGIDDTGQPGNGGTDQSALELGLHLQALNLAHLVHVSTHALIPADAIPGSFDNHASCLTLESEVQRQREIDMESRVFLIHHSAAGANAGFALASRDKVNERLLSWAKACRMFVMERQEALELARASGIVAAGFTGNGSGIIGAIAAIGLRFSGCDGWITWQPGLPDLKGIMTFGEILQHSTFDYVKSLRGKTPQFRDHIQLGERVTPLLHEGHSVLLLESAPRSATWDWTAMDIKAKNRIEW
jgi:hypothetical protein